jgi:hypothetical protein
MGTGAGYAVTVGTGELPTAIGAPALTVGGGAAGVGGSGAGSAARRVLGRTAVTGLGSDTVATVGPRSQDPSPRRGHPLPEPACRSASRTGSPCAPDRARSATRRRQRVHARCSPRSPGGRAWARSRRLARMETSPSCCPPRSSAAGARTHARSAPRSPASGGRRGGQRACSRKRRHEISDRTWWARVEGFRATGGSAKGVPVANPAHASHTGSDVRDHRDLVSRRPGAKCAHIGTAGHRSGPQSSSITCSICVIRQAPRPGIALAV